MCDLHTLDRQDLSVELEELCTRVARVEDEHTTEAEKLSELVMEVSNNLVYLGTLSIRDIPQLLKITQEVLEVAGLILECLQEEHASDTCPWDKILVGCRFRGPGSSRLLFFSFGIAIMYTHTHTYIYIYIGKLVTLHASIARSPAIARQGLGTLVRHATPPQMGAPIIDYLDHLFPKEGHHATSARVFLRLLVPSEGPRGHEILYHATVIKLVLDEVRMVQAGILEECLEVVCQQPRLALATTPESLMD
jgi:hypothetical protein